jgi:hypothetical protein
MASLRDLLFYLRRPLAGCVRDLLFNLRRLLSGGARD